MGQLIHYYSINDGFSSKRNAADSVKDEIILKRKISRQWYRLYPIISENVDKRISLFYKTRLLENIYAFI